MRKLLPMLTIVLAGSLSLDSEKVFASDSEFKQLQVQFQELQEQNRLLTIRVAELDERTVNKSAIAVPATETKQENTLSSMSDHLVFSGAIEVEAAWSEDFEGSSESTLDLATAELAIEAKLTDWATADMAIEWDGDDDKLTVDEAFITLGGTDSFPVFVQAGRYVTPFGIFDGNTISDPLTKEAFEAKEDAVMVGSEIGPVSISAYLYNGETNEGGGDDNIEHFGAAVGYQLERESFSIELHLGYTNSLGDSDTLEENYDTEADYIGGVSSQIGIRFAGAVFIAEYISALEEYESLDGSVVAKPYAYQLEAGYNLQLSNYPILVTVAYSGSADLGGLLPENRILASLGIELLEGLRFTLEYGHDIDYGTEEGGTGQESNTVIGQLAYEF